MVAPAPFAVTITVNDVDVTQYVLFESMTLDDYARQVSTLRMTIKKPVGVTPARQHEVKMTWNFDDSIIFLGYIMELKTSKRGITIFYDCECADRKILLQRTVIGGNEFEGSDIDILDDLFTNAYPDVTDYFDYSTDVTSFADGVELPVEDGENLLTMIDILAKILGAFPRWKKSQIVSNYTLDFEGAETYDTSRSTNLTIAEAAVGNPGNAIQATSASYTALQTLLLDIDLGEIKTITNVSFDIYVGVTGSPTNGRGVQVGLATSEFADGVPGGLGAGNITTTSQWNGYNEWSSYEIEDFRNGEIGWDQGLEGFTPEGPWEARYVTISKLSPANHTTCDIRIDNVVITYLGDGTPAKDSLVWDDTPELADFNIDVQSGDEYASDIDFSVGSLDDFNSVTVIGGYEEIAIDKALDNDGGRDHIALPYPVKTLAVYVNGGTDTTPAWGSALALGAWGSDVLTGDGGDKDVLFDNVNNVLFFDTAPPNMVNSYKITGTIQRPIRVRVENVAEDELTLATSYSDETITSIDQAVAIGAAQLEQRNSIRQLRFKTSHPGLKAGQSITVTDSARGLEETAVINRIGVTWLGSGGHAVFDVECGDADDSLATTLVNIDRQASSNGATTSPDTQTAYLLTVDSAPLTVNGQPLYYIA